MNLKILRHQLNKTQKDVAEELNMPRTMYARYEGEISQPDTKTLIKLADYFHTTVDHLLGHEVPFLLDKSILSSTQKEIVEILPQLNEDQSRMVVAYINGLLEGEADRLSFIERMKKNRPF